MKVLLRCLCLLLFLTGCGHNPTLNADSSGKRSPAGEPRATSSDTFATVISADTLMRSPCTPSDLSAGRCPFLDVAAAVGDRVKVIRRKNGLAYVHLELGRGYIQNAYGWIRESSISPLGGNISDSNQGGIKDFFIDCLSKQTGFKYRFNSCKRSVGIEGPKGLRKSAVGLEFVPGEGEDIVYDIMSDGSKIGFISGEEGSLRGEFNHGIFESNVVDKTLECKRGAANPCVNAGAIITDPNAPLPAPSPAGR